MFRKTHLYLTALCTGITAAIMIVMSLIYLYLSEEELYENQFHAFQNDIATITASLEQQTSISMEWLSRMEARSGYDLYVIDNGVPFLYNRLNGLDDIPDKQNLLNACLEAYHNRFEAADAPGAENMQTSYTDYMTSYRHTEFDFTPLSDSQSYFVSVLEMERGNSLLQIVILSPMNGLFEQIIRQRIRFGLIDFAAILLLSVFSYVFTGKILEPIEDNHRKQADFVAAASHELRTPLSVILSSAEYCQSAPDEARISLLSTIRQESLRLSKLVDDMLFLSQSDSKRFPIRPQDIELDTLALNVCEGFEPLAANKHINLTAKLPETAFPLCHADPDRIHQVISILLHNAISYTPEGGSVCLTLSYKKSGFFISVSDNGIGIAGEDRTKIFDRFYRAEKSRSTKGHFGLGLSIAAEIVRLHRGTIWVTEAPGGGSIFTFKLPGKNL